MSSAHSSEARAIQAAEQNALAQKFKALHQPGNPVFLANVYDAGTAAIVASHPGSKAIASASFAVAGTLGLPDPALTLPVYLSSLRPMASVVHTSGKPLTVDLQDGYEDPAATVAAAVRMGAVGCNLEDSDSPTGALRPVDEAVARIRQALDAAAALGVPDFVVNARTDALVAGYDLDEAISRGKRFLEAGATTVFVWGSKRGVSTEEVKTLVRELDGRVSVKMNLRPGFLKPAKLKDIGVSRVSVGPELFLRATAAFREGVDEVLGSRE